VFKGQNRCLNGQIEDFFRTDDLKLHRPDFVFQIKKKNFQAQLRQGDYFS
jgi:hypothetical protein